MNPDMGVDFYGDLAASLRRGRPEATAQLINTLGTRRRHPLGQLRRAAVDRPEPAVVSAARLVTDVLGTSAQWEFVRAIMLVFAVSALVRLIPVGRNKQR